MNNGPGFIDAGRLLSNLADSEKALGHLVRLALFNFLIGNADAHGKNFSLLYAQDSGIGPAPAYDLVSTQIYNEISPHFAMSYGKKTTPSAIDLNAWKKFARHLKMTEARLSAAMLGLISPVRKYYEPLLEAVLRRHLRFQEKGERLHSLIKNRLTMMEAAAENLARPGAGSE
jgi:serine/threonine-protein kinase HipA